MTLWELVACADGYRKHHGGEEKPDAPSAEEHLDRVMRLRKR